MRALTAPAVLLPEWGICPPKPVLDLENVGKCEWCLVRGFDHQQGDQSLEQVKLHALHGEFHRVSPFRKADANASDVLPGEGSYRAGPGRSIPEQEIPDEGMEINDLFVFPLGPVFFHVLLSPFPRAIICARY